MSHQSQCVSNPGPDSLQRPLTTPLATPQPHIPSQAWPRPTTQPPCHPAILPAPRPQHCPRYPGRVQACAGHRHTPRPSRMFEGLRWCMALRGRPVWDPGVGPCPRSAGFSGHPVRAGSYRRSPQALPHQLWGATLVTGALRGTGSWRGTWAPDPPSRWPCPRAQGSKPRIILLRTSKTRQEQEGISWKHFFGV